MFSPVKARRIFEEVVVQIREQIMSGELKPGDKLPAERDLAQQFDVGRNAVREALRVLEIAGTVHLKKGVRGGAFITAADPSVIADSLQQMLHLGQITAEELTEARIWIESIVVRVVCESGSEADFGILEANIARVERLMEEERDRDRVEANIEFHNLLAQGTKNPVLVLNMAMLMDIMRYFAGRVEPGDGQIILESRRRFMTFLRARNADAAVSEMTTLLKGVSERYENLAPIIEDSPTKRRRATSDANSGAKPVSRRRPQ